MQVQNFCELTHETDWHFDRWLANIPETWTHMQKIQQTYERFNEHENKGYSEKNLDFFFLDLENWIFIENCLDVPLTSERKIFYCWQMVLNNFSN